MDPTGNFSRTSLVSDELAAGLDEIEKSGEFNGHNQQWVRQLGILLILIAKPKTHEPLLSVHQMATLLDADLQTLLHRLRREGKA